MPSEVRKSERGESLGKTKEPRINLELIAKASERLPKLINNTGGFKLCCYLF